jgi:hypothetical protein
MLNKKREGGGEEARKRALVSVVTTDMCIVLYHWQVQWIDNFAIAPVWRQREGSAHRLLDQS